jgi:hypothetical protein
MKRMSKVAMAATLVLATANVWADTTNVYWKTWLVLPSVYDFNTAANWQYVNWSGDATTFGTNEIANFPFWYNSDQWTRDWRLHLSANITNYSALLKAPTVGHAATFDLDGRTWSLLSHFNLYSGRGGQIVLTNGVLDVGGNITLSATSDLSGLKTNAVLIANNVQMKGGTMNIDGIHVECKGGGLMITNGLVVGNQAAAGGMNESSLAFDRAAQCVVGGGCSVGSGAGTTGIFENVTGDVVVKNQLVIGSAGTGKLTLYGGTFTNTNNSTWHYIGQGATAVGVLNVLGGTNLLAATSASAVLAGRLGHGYIFGSGGLTTIKSTLYLAYYDGSEAEMTLSGGRWDITGAFQNGRNGRAHFTCSGGELNVGGSLYMGVGTNGVSEVDITGGNVMCSGDIPMGFEIGATAALRLSGGGVLTCGRIYKVKNDATVQTELTFDGGTLQAQTSGTLIDVVDSVCLGTNGLVVNSMGKNVSIASALRNVSGQAGSLTKLGTGALTLMADRTATGPVSVETGTLMASNGLTVAEGVSLVNGTLTLTSGSLSVAAGAVLAGTGTVSSVSMAGSAVFRRAKSDGATTPLQAESFAAAGPFTIALTGYTLADLKTALPLIRTVSPLDVSSATVTVDGMVLPRVCAMTRTDQNRNLLVVGYLSGTLISIY